jgi:PleD family two-component response regulator
MRVPWSASHSVSVEEVRRRINKTDLVILKPEISGFETPKEIFDDIDDMVFEVPIIVLASREDDKALSTYVMEEGAADIVIRGQFSRLIDAIEFALIRQRIATFERQSKDTESSKHSYTQRAVKNENLAREERHQQILRMFAGDYALDQLDPNK